MPRLSVLLPCRDAEAYLGQAMRCLEAQTYRDFEVVAVDDGSTDETAALLASWSSRDPRVQLLSPGRVGLVEALRLGTAHCSGDLLARFDADDLAQPTRFAEQIGYLDARPRVAAVGTRIRYFPWERVGWGARRYQTWLNRLSEPDELARDIFVECPVAHPSMMIRRESLARVGGYRANGWPEDYDLVLRLHAGGARLANVPRVLHFWRETDGRASRTDPRYSREAFLRCKIEFLRRGALKSRREVRIWGAGVVGKGLARALRSSGIEVAAFYDIDPRRIGQEVHGAPVLDIGEVARRRDAYLLVAVGAAGARELIRAELTAAGFCEPADYRVVA